jgi:spoIIIJ-associated protein
MFFKKGMVKILKRQAVASGKTVEEAINSACESLGVKREDVEFEILDMPSKKLLGLIGGSDAKVKISIEETIEQRAKIFLKKILDNMGLSSVLIESRETLQGIYFDVTGGEAVGIIIGHRGETLDALQYLVSLVANKGEADFKRIIIDTGSYREKRETTLTSLAKRIALSVVKTRKSQTLEPMNPYERRIIHTAVQEISGAESWSVGEEPNRKVVIGVVNGEREKNYTTNKY